MKVFDTHYLNHPIYTSLLIFIVQRFHKDTLKKFLAYNKSNCIRQY